MKPDSISVLRYNASPKKRLTLALFDDQLPRPTANEKAENHCINRRKPWI